MSWARRAELDIESHAGPVDDSGQMGVLGFAEVTLEVTDPRAVADFYCRAFGLTELSEEGDRIWLGVGRRARLGIWTPGTKEFGDEGGAHVHFAFTVRSGTMDELARRVTEAGAEIHGPVEHSGGDRSLYVRDPAGNIVEAWDIFDGAETVNSLRQ